MACFGSRPHHSTPLPLSRFHLLSLADFALENLVPNHSLLLLGGQASLLLWGTEAAMLDLFSLASLRAGFFDEARWEGASLLSHFILP